eukprot:Tbor_TRINITY_DN4718_c0_g1::TRINITY_DN4718_c0_g1_i1::g.16875::m.16875
MSLKQTFLERTPAVSEEKIDILEQLLRTKIDLKTGYAEPHALSRCMLHNLRIIDTSDDQVMTRDSFRLLMSKMNCGNDKLVCDALFHRYDRRATGKVTLKDFADGLFGLLPVAGSVSECRDIISIVRKKLLEMGENGFRGLSRTLFMMDENGNKTVCKTELQRGLSMYGIELTNFEVKTLMHYFDKNNDGSISVKEFMVGLRPQMSDSRTALVKLAFLRLDKNSNGVVTYGELRQMYRPDKHPAVLRGEKTQRDIMEEFLSAWNQNPDDVITEEEFIEFYSDLSASIDNDAYFELMIRNSWHISKGQSDNADNLRMLVTHMDGTQTVETIDNDLGVNFSNKHTLITTLRKQGITDILKAEPALYC